MTTALAGLTTGAGSREAVCRLVEATGRRAAIGRLEAIPELVAGTGSTQIDGSSPAVRPGRW